MPEPPVSPSLEQRSNPANGERITCDRCEAEAPGYIETLLYERAEPVNDNLALHLETCPACLRLGVDLIDLMTAPQVKALQETLIDPAREPDHLAGLLKVRQMHLAACNRLDDLPGVALGLSLVGMIRRRLGAVAEAEDLHNLAMQQAEESEHLLSLAMSACDLGALALAKKQGEQARRYFEEARPVIERMADREAEARLYVLLGRVAALEQDWPAAQTAYRAAKEIAAAIDYAFITETAGQLEAKMRRAARLRRRVDDLAAAVGETSQPVTTLRQMIKEFAGAALGSLEQPLPGLIEDLLNTLTTTLGETKQLTALYSGWLKPRYSFAPQGEKVLVLNNAKEILIHIPVGPFVDAEGNVVIVIKLDAAVLEELPQDFRLDLLFLPIRGVLRTFEIGRQERLALRTEKGLELKARLPAFEGFLPELQTRLEQRSAGHRKFPRTAFAFLVWWPEE